MVILHIGMDSIGTTKRNLLNPDELIQLDNTKEIVILRGKKPLMCDKFDYSEHRLATELKMLDDDYIPGTKVRKPRAQRLGETEDEYLEYLENYYATYLPGENGKGTRK